MILVTFSNIEASKIIMVKFCAKFYGVTPPTESAHWHRGQQRHPVGCPALLQRVQDDVH